MAKIIGNIVGLPSPRSDWNQNDEMKADFIKNKPDIKGMIAEEIGDINTALLEIIELQEELMTPDGDGVKY